MSSSVGVVQKSGGSCDVSMLLNGGQIRYSTKFRKCIYCRHPDGSCVSSPGFFVRIPSKAFAAAATEITRATGFRTEISSFGSDPRIHAHHIATDHQGHFPKFRKNFCPALVQGPNGYGASSPPRLTNGSAQSVVRQQQTAWEQAKAENVFQKNMEELKATGGRKLKATGERGPMEVM